MLTNNRRKGLVNEEVRRGKKMAEMNQESDSPDQGSILISVIRFWGGSPSRLSYPNTHVSSFTTTCRGGGTGTTQVQGMMGGGGSGAEKRGGQDGYV